MLRSAVWLLAALMFAVPGPLRAQPTPEPKDGKVTIPLLLVPAAAPKPASKYYLYPEYRDLQPGDKLSGFLKCFMEQDTFFNQENTEKRQKWLEMSMADLPADVREQAGIKNGIAYDPPYTSFMVFMDQAARYTWVEWNEWFNLRKDGVYLLLPELQKLRQVAQVLSLRLRSEVKTREFERAIATVKSLLGLADLCRQHPTLIGGLVGTAIAAIAVNGVEELIQQPGCPNLFWSLTDLPVPLVPMRTGLAGERVFVAAQFDGLLRADRPLSDAELERHQKLLAELLKVQDNAEPAHEYRQRYAVWAADPKRVEAGRKRLVEAGGMPPETVAKFGPLQVILTDDLVRYEVIRDDLFRWFNLPLWQMAVGAEDEEAEIKKAKADTILAPQLIAALLKVKQTEARLDQRVAFLRVIEAVRLHAHENGGKLPGSLAEIKLPLPTDPVSGKPFDYVVNDGVATLSGTNATPGRAETNRVYELRLWRLRK